MDTDSFKLSVNTKKLVKNPKNFEDLFDFSLLNEKHVIFSNKNKKIGNLKIEAPKKL